MQTFRLSAFSECFNRCVTLKPRSNSKKLKPHSKSSLSLSSCVYFHRMPCWVSAIFATTRSTLTLAIWQLLDFPSKCTLSATFGHIKHSRESNTAIWLKKLRSQKMKKAPTLCERFSRATTMENLVNTPTNEDVAELLYSYGSRSDGFFEEELFLPRSCRREKLIYLFIRRSERKRCPKLF